MKYFNFYFYFCLAAGLGSVIRFLIISLTPNISKFFTGVFFVNIIGSLLMGVLSISSFIGAWHIIIGTGFIGGLTTFSTMMTQGEQLNSYKFRIFYFLITLIFGMVFFLIGTRF